MRVMRPEDAECRDKFIHAVQWSKARISNFRIDERRKASTIYIIIPMLVRTMTYVFMYNS